VDPYQYYPLYNNGMMLRTAQEWAYCARNVSCQ